MKLQLLWAARDGRRDALVAQLDGELDRCADRLGAAARLCVLARLPDDPFARFQPPMRGFDAALEIVTPGDAQALGEATAGVGERLAAAAHVDLSAAFAGPVNSVVPPEPATYRYLYVMRRRAGTTHAAYLDHYTNVHADFGRRTPATVGYEQHHLDEEASRALALAAGVGLWCADSISELSIPDVGAFLAALATSPIASEGPADEQNFVDRPNSVGQCMQVLRRREPDD